MARIGYREGVDPGRKWTIAGENWCKRHSRTGSMAAVGSQRWSEAAVVKKSYVLTLDASNISVP